MKNRELYYRPSGIAPLKGVFLMLLIGIPSAILFGVGYSWCLWKIPFIYLDVILTVIFGGLLGIIAKALIRFGNIRSMPVALLLGFIIAMVGVYAKWTEWSVMVDTDIFEGYGGMQTNIFTTFLNPLDIWERMTTLNKIGLWSISDFEFNGVSLWIVWAIEAGMILFFTLAFVFRQVQLPFSESNNKWMTGIISPEFIIANIPFKEMRQQLEQGNFTSLLNGQKTQNKLHIRWTTSLYNDDSVGEYYLEVVEEKAVKNARKTSKPEAALFYSDGKSFGLLRISKVNYEMLLQTLGGEIIEVTPWTKAELLD